MVKNFICPVDGRRFSTKAALAQHERTHAQPMPAPRARPRAPRRRVTSKPKTSGVAMQSVVTSGTDCIENATIASNATKGAVMFCKALTPFSIPNTRIQIESLLWQRWRPKKLTVTTVGSGPATAGGAYVLAWIPDPHLVSGARIDYLSLALSAERSKVVRFDQAATFEVPCGLTTKWLLTEGTPENISHGTFIAAVITPPVGIKGAVTVPLILNWHVEWQGRKLASAILSNQILTPDTGYQNLFTTSDSGFDATILTFKMHSGGSMVPFSHALPGVVYTSVEGTVVYYVNNNGQNAECRYFSRILNYETPGLVLHTSAAEGLEYQRTADLTHCIHYVGASNTAKPAIPKFKSVRDQSDEPLPAPVSELDSLRQQVDHLRQLVEKLTTAEPNFRLSPRHLPQEVEGSFEHLDMSPFVPVHPEPGILRSLSSPSGV